ETRKKAVKSQLELAAGSDIVELHPQAAEPYAVKVAEIHGPGAWRRCWAGGYCIGARVGRARTRHPQAAGRTRGEIAGNLAAILSVNEKGPLVWHRWLRGLELDQRPQIRRFALLISTAEIYCSVPR